MLPASRVVALTCAAWLVSAAIGAQEAPADGPRYVSETELARPANYREWVFLSSGLGMAYTDKPQPPSFTNVFVNPSAYRSFVESGVWPDKTMLVLESRSSSSEGSINKSGRFQTAVRSLEVEVKDVSRFPPTGWAFFAFGAGARARDRAAPLPRTRDCYTCHADHAAVDNTFVQFYPTLLEIARQKGTLRAGF